MRSRGLIFTLLVALPLTAFGGSFSLVLETDANEPGGSEVFLATYDSLAEFLSGSLASSGFSDIDISSAFGIGGFAFDGAQYHLILESDADEPGGSEVFLITYDSLDDFLSGNLASAGFSDVNVAAAFGIGGFASDGDQYHLILESNADEPGGSEIFLTTFDSLADFLSGNLASAGFSDVNVAAAFGVGGFASDGDQYHLILESDADEPSGSEVFLATYDSLAGFLSASSVSDGFSDIGVGSAFGVGGISGQVPLFADGFESGDTSAWSITGP